MQYVYALETLDREPEGPTSAKVTPRRLLSGPTFETGKSSTVGAVLTGTHIACTLGRQQQGSGAKPHTHPNEQFNYVLQGVMIGEICGEPYFGEPGMIVHVPAAAVHSGMAGPDGDLVFFAMKDTRHGIVGPPIDGVYDGPAFLPGFGKRSGEPVSSVRELAAQAGWSLHGQKTRHVYTLGDDDVKASKRSADVRRIKLSDDCPSDTMVLASEKLEVGVMRLPAGHGTRFRRDDSEQIILVASGCVTLEIDGREERVDARSVIHLPPGVSYRLCATAEGDATIVNAREARFPLA